MPADGQGFPVRRDYDVRDVEGKRIARHHRLDYGPKDKRLWWQLPDGTAGLNGLPVTSVPLYGSERLRGYTPDQPLYVCEGEKATEAAWALGLQAVGTVTGASGLPDDDVLATLLPFLDGPGGVVVWPDNDDPGRRHMERIAARLRALYPTGSVRRVAWPDAPPHGDAADYAAQGGTAAGLVQEAGDGAADRREPEPPAGAARGMPDGLLFLTAAELLERRASRPALRFLPLFGQDGYFVEGWSHLIAGYPKTGKTELMTAQTPAWGHLSKRILYITEEPEHIWAERMERGGGRAAFPGLTVLFGLNRPPELLLAAALAWEWDIVLLDTMRNLLQLKDETDNSAVAAALNPWIGGLRDAGRTLFMLHHTRKGAGSHGEGIAGAHALLAAFDFAMEVERDGQHEYRRRIKPPLARLLTPPELHYEQGEDGRLAVSGGSSTADGPTATGEEEVLAMLEQQGDGMTEERLVVSVGVSRRQMQEVLKRLMRRGKVQRTGTGKKGDPFRYRAVDAAAAANAAMLLNP